MFIFKKKSSSHDFFKDAYIPIVFQSLGLDRLDRNRFVLDILYQLNMFSTPSKDPSETEYS